MDTTGWVTTHFKPTDFMRVLTIRGRKVDVAVSPYDIPEAFRATLDRNSQTITIELKYINNEEEIKSVSLSSEIDADIGKASHRIYALRFPFDPEGGTPADQVRSATKRLKETFDRSNSQLVEGALRAGEAEIAF